MAVPPPPQPSEEQWIEAEAEARRLRPRPSGCLPNEFCAFCWLVGSSIFRPAAFERYQYFGLFLCAECWSRWHQFEEKQIGAGVFNMLLGLGGADRCAAGSTRQSIRVRIC